MMRRLPALSLILALALLASSAGPHAGDARAAAGPPIDGAAGPTAPGLYLYDLNSGTWSSISPADDNGAPPSYAWSPDGTKLAVAAGDPSTDGGLQVIDLPSGRTSSALSAKDGIARSLAWAPDSGRLAFIFEAPVNSGSSVNSALRVWNAAGGSLKTLVPNLARRPVWTPDGGGITVIISDTSGDLTSSGNRIVTLDPTTGDTLQTIASGPPAVCQVGMAWSPDGSYLAYGGSGFHEGCLPGATGLFTWYAPSGTTTRLADGTAEAPIWLPDGTVLDEVAGMGGPTGLGSISLAKFQPDGTGEQVLASAIPNDFPPPNPRFQAAGGEIVYATMNCGGADVYVIDQGSSRPRRLNTGANHAMYAMYPRLSPDGQTVAWTGAGAAANALTLAPVSGGPTTTVLDGATGIMPGNFSPSGRWLAFDNLAQGFDPCAVP